MQKLYTVKNSILACILAVALFWGAMAFPAFGTSARAVNNDLAFDNSPVLDDLLSSDTFKLSDFPLTAGTPRLLQLVEYGYTYRSNMQDNYALYAYVYNPETLDIDTENFGNKIQLAVSWRMENDIEVVSNYAKYSLAFCNMSEGNYKGLFYKFRIIDSVGQDGESILSRMNAYQTQHDGARRYDVSGIELVTRGAPNAQEYTVGGTYRYTGFSKGYGADLDADSTLACSVTELETVELEVHSTYYRTPSASTGKDHQNQLTSVYFAVPNELFDRYGNLQKIKAEWYEYKTAPIVVTADSDVISNLTPLVGVNKSNYDSSHYELLYNEQSYSNNTVTSIGYTWSYNANLYADTSWGHTSMVESAEDTKLLTYLFGTGGVPVTEYDISPKKMTEYIYTYDKSFHGGTLPIKNNSISADLFMATVDTGRTRGYNCVEIDAGDKYDLLSYSDTNSFWNRVGDYGLWTALFGKTPVEGGKTGIDPIRLVDSSELSGDIAEKLMIRSDDVDAFKTYVSNAEKQDKQTVLFRFAATDYFSGYFAVNKHDGNYSPKKASGYMARETVFLDFDILQLTFHRNGVYHVIAAVSSPIDIIPGITHPTSESGCNAFAWLLTTIIVLILFLILFPYIQPVLGVIGTVLLRILKVLWWVISLPFKGIAAMIKSANNSAKRRKAVKAQKAANEPIYISNTGVKQHATKGKSQAKRTAKQNAQGDAGRSYPR